MTASPKPLAGVKVLDFGHTIMGPCAGVVFADLGADVVKIEPADGDPTRRLPGFAAGFFATYNRNKRSIAVDLKRPDGQAVVHRLVARPISCWRTSDPAQSSVFDAAGRICARSTRGLFISP